MKIITSLSTLFATASAFAPVIVHQSSRQTALSIAVAGADVKNTQELDWLSEQFQQMKPNYVMDHSSSRDNRRLFLQDDPIGADWFNLALEEGPSKRSLQHLLQAQGDLNALTKSCFSGILPQNPPQPLSIESLQSFHPQQTELDGKASDAFLPNKESAEWFSRAVPAFQFTPPESIAVQNSRLNAGASDWFAQAAFDRGC